MRNSDQRGFTLVEMLVVLIIIGVLAAIALPAFLNQNRKANDAEAKSQLNTAAKVLGARAAENGTYASTAADLVAAEPSLSAAIDLQVTAGTQKFLVELDSPSGAHYTLERLATGATRRDCAPRGTGGCASTADGAGNHW